ncbi:MAG: FHA domain-containing protein [Clostridia bacterium]|nr:FHA domain-containing protein [Clostridia bacterium]
MSAYSIISSLLSYVFTTIIYLFIFSVIALIYMDIKKMGKKEKREQADSFALKDKSIDHYAVLKTVKNKKLSDVKIKAAYRINGKGVIIGRSKDCDISISHKFVSVEHFQVWYDEGFWYIGDMGSKNGTYLNGARIKKVKTLQNDDRIAFGGLEFIFREEE